MDSIILLLGNREEKYHPSVHYLVFPTKIEFHHTQLIGHLLNVLYSILPISLSMQEDNNITPFQTFNNIPESYGHNWYAKFDQYESIGFCILRCK